MSIRFLTAAAFAVACGNTPTFTPFIAPPRFMAAGVTALEVPGNFFDSTTVVFWNGKRQATHYVSPTHVNVTLDSGLTDKAAVAMMTAQNDGSPMSAPAEVDIFQQSMQLTAVAPAQAALGGPSMTLSLTGSGFRASDVVLWNGVQLATSFQSATTLTATVPASLLAVPSDGFVRVFDPECGPPASSLCTTLTTELAVVVGTSVRTQSFAVDVAWDAADSLLLRTVETGFNTTALDTVDPATLRTVTRADFSATRTRVAVSAQDQFVYAYGPFNSSPPSTVEPVRLSLPGLTGSVTLTGFSTGFFFGSAVAPAPDLPATVAILSGGAARIVDGTTPRPNAGDATGVDGLEWGFDASTLYGLTATGLVRFSIDANGVASRADLGSSDFRASRRLHYDRTTRRIYGDSGENVDEQGLDPRPFDVGATSRSISCSGAIDATLGKAFYFCIDFDIGMVIKSFDLATQKPIGNVLLSTTSSTGSFDPATHLIRFGANGLAVTVDGTLLVYQGPFVQ